MQNNRNIDDDLTNTCMLVSDSDEVRDQLDSKKLEYSTLVDLAEDNLFRKHLDMSRYLTYNQFGVYSEMLNDKYNELNAMGEVFSRYSEHKPRFRVVDGQVILVEVDALKSQKLSPEDYVRSKWDITSEYQLLPIPNCMLRGMLDLNAEQAGEVTKLVPEKQDNEKVRLTEVNMPPHMHHSSVTTGANFTTIVGVKSAQPSEYFTKGNTVYDMFYNDSKGIGLSKNELDGTVDEFTVDEVGGNDSSEGQSKSLSHDNMPKYHAFYGFVVQKTARQD